MLSLASEMLSTGGGQEVTEGLLGQEKRDASGVKEV